MPKVSVIIPNYNHARFLEQRINTVLNQTYQDFDLLILDDCSKDDSRTIIESYRKHPKVTILYNEENSGSVFKQWGKGINNTTGKYIWIAESDDYSDITFLEEMVKLLETYPTAGIIYCASNVSNEQGIAKDIMKRPKQSYDKVIEKDVFLINGRDECNNLLLKKCSIPNVSSAVVVRKAINHLELSYNFKLAGDWLFYINIALHYDFIYLNNPLNYFRYLQNSVGNTATLAVYCKEKLKIYFYLDKHLIYRQKLRLEYIKDYSYSFIFYLLKKELLLKQIDFFNILKDLRRIHFLSFIIIIVNLIRLFKRALIKIIQRPFIFLSKLN